MPVGTLSPAFLPSYNSNLYAYLSAAVKRFVSCLSVRLSLSLCTFAGLTARVNFALCKWKWSRVDRERVYLCVCCGRSCPTIYLRAKTI